MTDDIVTRLRDWANRLYPMKYGACMEEAADEIKYLQTENAEWRRQAMFWHDQATKLALEGLKND